MTGTLDDLEKRADRLAGARDFGAAERLLAEIAAQAPERAVVWLKLCTMRRALGDIRGALDAISGALKLDPLGFTPLMMKAGLLEKIGRDEEADELYAAALFQAPSEDRVSPAMREQMSHARKRCEARAHVRSRELASAVAPAMAGASLAETRRITRFQSNVLRQTRPWHQEATHFHFPELPEIEFFDPADFANLMRLEEEAEVIRDEFSALARSQARQLEPYVQYADDVPQQMPALNRSLDWSALHLVQFGASVPANASHCPRTMAAFAALDTPDIPGRSPNLMFSLLAPRTRIPPHHGVANTRLVFHLPLIVPPGCGFRVGGETREWVPGKLLVFDDTIEHEAWNDSDELRVVLIGDLWRPELSVAERAAARAIIGASEAVAD